MSRKLHVVALGGTIASADAQLPVGTAGKQAEGVQPTISGQDIAASAGLDELFQPDGLSVTFDQVAQVGGPNVTLQVVSDVIDSCHDARQHEGAEAAVVTQGTDSLEETAFAVSMLNNSGIPIVVTGAMRHPSLPGADGPANVRSATLTALSLADHGLLGAAMVIADEIHDPWFVRKAHTTSLSAFTSGPVLGALGWISEGRVILIHGPSPRDMPSWTSRPSAVGPIPIIEAGSGDGLDILDSMTLDRFSGAIIAGLGGGHVPENSVERISALASRMPVVISSRTGAGATLRHTYAWSGGDIDLRKRGLISAGILDPRKARIALLLCLAHRLNPEDFFAQYFQGTWL